MIRYFNATHIPVAARAFSDAEKLVSRHFRLTEDDLRKNKYDVKTLAFLEQHEVNDGAFAHLCKYSYEKSSDGKPEEKEGFEFYRVCLQDHIILDALERANTFIKLSPLMLYIAVHELIHVLRFSTGAADFSAPQEEKEQEEKIVHNLTRSALQPARQPDMNMVLDCFSSEYKISNLYN